jgi:hypothetical protein
VGVQFQHSRIKLLGGFTPDPDPNLVSPSAEDRFVLKDRPPYGGLAGATQGNTVFLDFRDAGGSGVYGAAADWQTWFLDEQSLIWTNALPVLKAAHLDAYETRNIKPATCYVQIQAIYTIGAAVSVTIRMMEI